MLLVRFNVIFLAVIALLTSFSLAILFFFHCYHIDQLVNKKM